MILARALSLTAVLTLACQSAPMAPVGVSEPLGLRAANRFEQACGLGDVAACGDLGALFVHGSEGVPRDAAVGAALLGDACARDALGACIDLAALHVRGDGVKRDVGRAAVLLERACTRGAARGCAGLGELYEEGLGV